MIRVLLDEDLDVRLRLHFGPDFHVETVDYRGWKGQKNAVLLTLAAPDFDVLVSADSNLQYQQNISKYELGLVVLRPRSKALLHLIELVPEAAAAIKVVTPGTVLEVWPRGS